MQSYLAGEHKKGLQIRDPRGMEDRRNKKLDWFYLLLISFLNVPSDEHI